MDLIEQMNWRYATKIFDKNKKIDKENLNTIKESMLLTASSFGLQPWKFLFITDQNLKEKLRPVSWDQSQVTDCSVLVVLCYLKDINSEYIEKYVNDIAKTRGVDRSSLDGFSKMMNSSVLENKDKDERRLWALKQVYIALGNLLTTAAVLNIDACPMEGFSSEDYDEILGLKDTPYRSAVVCPLGYRSDEDKYASLPKVRFSKREIIEDI